jgi:uncharacterized glyoxalase superfamily protein PhnB
MITRVVPKLPFIEKQQTIEFYVNGLGFSLQSDYGDYFIISFSEAELHFFSYPGLDRNKSDFMIYLRVNTGIEDLYETLQKNNIAIHPNGKLEDKPWKQREFSIIDPNGTLLTFGQAIK